MSANRAVLAAQRRRAGGPEPAAPGRPGPQPSINSSQMFSQQGQQQAPNQVRPGTNGRLAGQHAQQQQQQMQQQQQQMQQDHKEQGLAGVNKMTLAQAITLITLRLGKIETHLNEQDNSNSGIDSGIIDVIMSRLEELEGQTVSPSTPNSSPNSSVEFLELKQTVDALKQQIDTFKPLLTQSKTSLAILSNEHKGFKQDIESIKAELSVLQNLTMEHNQQILQLSLYTDNAVNNNADGAILEEIVDVDVDIDNNSDIVGTDLKELIEQELNNA